MFENLHVFLDNPQINSYHFFQDVNLDIFSAISAINILSMSIYW